MLNKGLTVTGQATSSQYKASKSKVLQNLNLSDIRFSFPKL
jgi:hypothetical protein